METWKVLIIEDEKSDFEKIKADVVPQEMLSVFDDADNATGGLSEREMDSVAKFKSTEAGALKASMSFIADTLNNHYQDIRVVICDLQINGDDQGGARIIDMIRHNKNLTFSKSWYGENIPIVIISKLEDKDKYRALEMAADNSYFLPKSEALTGDGSALLRTIISKMAKRFEDLYRDYESRKKYKVALSFTASNVDADGKELKIRRFIQEIARELDEEYTREKVFYDMNHQEESNGKDKEEFARTYNDAEYIVAFISEGYKDKTSRWSTAEWEVIKNLENREKKVIYVAIDSTLKEEDFKNCLGIKEVIYKDLLSLCSDYNKLYHAEDEELIQNVKENFYKMSAIQIAAYSIDHYYNHALGIIKEATSFIVKTINLRDSK